MRRSGLAVQAQEAPGRKCFNSAPDQDASAPSRAVSIGAMVGEETPRVLCARSGHGQAPCMEAGRGTAPCPVRAPLMPEMGSRISRCRRTPPENDSDSISHYIQLTIAKGDDHTGATQAEGSLAPSKCPLGQTVVLPGLSECAQITSGYS